MMKEKDLEVLKTTEKIQYTFDKYSKKTSSEALLSPTKNEKKGEPLHKTIYIYIGKYGTRSEERLTERNCRY